MSFSEKQKEMREKLAKEAIYEAAVELIVEQGFDHLTMNDIAQRTGMATGTIYNYFSNKESLLFYIHSRLHRIFIEKGKIIADEQGDAFDRFKRYVEEVVSFCGEYQSVFTIADKLGIKDRIPLEEKQEMMDKVIFSIKRIFDDGIAQKKIKNINTSKAAKVFLFSLIGVLEVESFFNYKNLSESCGDLIEIFSEYLLAK